MTITASADDVFFRDAPTVVDVSAIYGYQTVLSWLIAQLVNISEFCGARFKLTDFQVMELAELIAGEFFFLKLTEFMLFCRRFKAGRYGQFYGTVDPMTIMSSLRDFMKDRNMAYARLQQQQ